MALALSVLAHPSLLPSRPPSQCLPLPRPALALGGMVRSPSSPWPQDTFSSRHEVQNKRLVLGGKGTARARGTKQEALGGPAATGCSAVYPLGTEAGLPMGQEGRFHKGLKA